MKKNVHEKMALATAAKMLKAAADILDQCVGTAEPDIPLAPPSVFTVIARRYPYFEKKEMAGFDILDALRAYQEADDHDTDEFDEEDYDCDDWDDQEDCPDYDPISETNDRCLFLCPGCGTCMKKHLEEDMV